jgi:hypothetical protein
MPSSDERRRARWDRDSASCAVANETAVGSSSVPMLPNLRSVLMRCFWRPANLSYCTLDRLSRYKAIFWRQVRQILIALDALDRRKSTGQRARFPPRLPTRTAGL